MLIIFTTSSHIAQKKMPKIAQEHIDSSLVPSSAGNGKLGGAWERGYIDSVRPTWLPSQIPADIDD